MHIIYSKHTIWLSLKEKDKKQLNHSQTASIYDSLLCVANFMKIRLQIRKLLKIENLEISSWEPENQCGCDVTSSQWLLMDGWIRVLHPLNSISVILRRWKGEHERLCAMKRRLGSGRISPPAGFEPVTPWSEVGRANCSAMRRFQWLLIFSQ